MQQGLSLSIRRETGLTVQSDWPSEADKLPGKTDVEWRDVYNYNNCIEEFPDQHGLVTSKHSYPDPNRVEESCLHMSVGKYCDEETYSMDFVLDGKLRFSRLRERG